MATTILQEALPGGRIPGRQNLRWGDSIKDWTYWTGLTIGETHPLAKDREA